MKDKMPKPGVNRTQPMVFIPNPTNGLDFYNRKTLRQLAKEARDYRGNISRKNKK